MDNYQRHTITIEIEADPTVDIGSIEEKLIEQAELLDGVLAAWVP